PLGIVLALRARIGIMEIFSSDIQVDHNLDEVTQGYRERLRDLGPLRQRLRGGGSISVRGYRPNELGDVTQVDDRLDSGGLRQWEASAELRVPLTTNVGTVWFVDVGDVTREKRFRFSQPQTTLGFGLRYKTLIGPVRLDFGFAPKSLQSIGADQRTRERFTQDGTPEPFDESTIFGTGGAIHFTIGEAF
ncbi:MAG TPA: BamA/TamA family outer membrane protein, partial [Polyangiales bacterium]|nr:BamA/TamA family outer membrane protein [Polyangiales bacterium]